jgi:hypothetical protein
VTMVSTTWDDGPDSISFVDNMLDWFFSIPSADEKENSKPAKPTAHNDHRNRAPSPPPARGATPPPSGGGGPSPPEKEHPHKPPHDGAPPRPSSSSREKTPPLSRSPSPPAGPDWPRSFSTAASALSEPGLFEVSAAGLRVEPGAFATSGLDDPSELRVYTQAKVHLFTLRADAPLLFQPPKPEGYFNLYPGFYPWRSPPSSYWYTKR